jgi:hypothetical protein
VNLRPRAVAQLIAASPRARDAGWALPLGSIRGHPGARPADCRIEGRQANGKGDGGFSQRYSGIFSDDGETIAGSWEICHDGTTWEHDFELTYSKER